MPSALASADLHMHTHHSCDAHDSVEDMVRSAMEKGLHTIAITEHIDWHPNDNGYGVFNFQAYSDDINRARDKYGDRITILKGFEASEANLYRQAYADELSRDYDIVLCSMHWVGGALCGDPAVMDAGAWPHFIEAYLLNLLACIDMGGFQVLAHFDFPRRYYGQMPMPEDLVREVLKKAAQKGVALEINTSGIRKGYPDTLPGKEYIRWFEQYGGQRVTFGSDAHRTCDIAADFDRAIQAIEGTRLLVGTYNKRQFQPLIPKPLTGMVGGE
nr:histidinol-phosphatase HisJ family protein [bacterium]